MTALVDSPPGTLGGGTDVLGLGALGTLDLGGLVDPFTTLMRGAGVTRLEDTASSSSSELLSDPVVYASKLISYGANTSPGTVILGTLGLRTFCPSIFSVIFGTLDI